MLFVVTVVPVAVALVAGAAPEVVFADANPVARYLVVEASAVAHVVVLQKKKSQSFRSFTHITGAKFNH